MRRAVAFVLVAPLILLVGCTAQHPDPTRSAPPSASDYVSSYETPAPTQLAPLRGTTIPAGSADNPSIAAKIDNHEGARPQVALESTDIVYEELVEGGITRYVAVWQATIPELLGPVRSIRPMDPDIISPLGGIVAYSGGQEIFVAMMQDAPVVNVVFDFDDGTLFYRDDVHDSPHDVILRAPLAIQRNAGLAPTPQQFAYSSDVATATATQDGTPTASINAVFSSARFPSFAWDEANKYWLRSQEGAPDLDSTGAQLHATNVVTMRVDIDGQYGYVPKTVMIGSGEAWVSTGGKTVHATWAKADATSPIVLTDDAGTIIRLAPGNTWVELVPNGDGSVSFQ